MPRASLALVALLAIGCMGVVGYSCATRMQTDRVESNGKSPAASHPEAVAKTTNPVADAAQQPTAGAAQVPPVARNEASQLAVIPQETVAKWIAAATGADPEARAAAIVALAKAPKSQAVPVLTSVMNAGEPVDRPLALLSLRAVALEQGDADGGIRAALRNVIYDGGDEDVTRDAQAVLDEVESGPGQIAPDPR